MSTRHPHVRTTHAFTLIEVLLTMVLAAALLAGLWTLLSMHSRLFDTGQTKTEQSQLARTLLQQMSDDLHAIVQAPPPPPPAPPQSGLLSGGPGSAPPSSNSPTTAGTPGVAPATGANGASAPPSPAGAQSAVAPPANPAADRSPGPAPVAPASPAGPNATAPPIPNATPPASSALAVTSSLRPSGLFGTENYLQMDILQPAVARPEAELDERLPMGAKRPSRAAELQTVVYAFEEGRDPQHPSGELRTFLVRRELDWEQAHAAKRAPARPPRGPFSTTDGTDAAAMMEPIPSEVRSEGADDKSSAKVPEVAQFGIRYFDGGEWLKEWDSATRKALPLAIEVVVQLRAFDEPEQQSHHLTNESASEESKVKPPQLPIYRLVIHLPAAAEPVHGDGRSQLVNFGGRGGAERPLGADTNGARR
ncbi:MAG: prepilin-type N-terminal cleavage/methylation domain-containing protein [Planctomycetia bacterium]|nr:prepilin-type N-terminal cleavage/methylation domain-containing protein [Planctomycetia bacterium]